MAWSSSNDGYYDSKDEEDYEPEGIEVSKDEILEMAKERLQQLFPFHCAETTRSVSAFMAEAETCLGDVHKHEALLEFITTMPDELDKQRMSRMILDLFNEQQEQENFPTRITNKYMNHVLVCIIQYLFECPSEEWMGYVMDIVNKAHQLHLNLRKIEHAALKDRLEKLISQGNFAQRPWEPTCCFYMNYGRCRFGERCRFHHPPERLSAADEKNHDSDAAADRLFKDMTCCQDVLLLLDGMADTDGPAPPPVDNAADDVADSPFAELVRPRSKRKARPAPPRPAPPRPEDEAIRRGLAHLGLPATAGGERGDAASRGRTRDAVQRIQQERAAEYLPFLATERYAELARQARELAASELCALSRREALSESAAVVRPAPAALREVGGISAGKVGHFCSSHAPPHRTSGPQ